jgi:hypothetical protein
MLHKLYNDIQRMIRISYFQTVLIIVTVFATSVAVAEDFKIVNGKEYKNATISRVEPDGIVIKYKVGISKIYVMELPKEVRERFYYDPFAFFFSEEPRPHIKSFAFLMAGTIFACLFLAVAQGLIYLRDIRDSLAQKT